MSRRQRAVARIGGPMSYGDLAARGALGRRASADALACGSVGCLEAVRYRRARPAVVPAENSITG